MQNQQEKLNNCTKDKCPLHGYLRTRKHVKKGVVSSNLMMKTIVIKNFRTIKNQKYKRFLKSTSKISLHVPECLGTIKVGDQVLYKQTRPLSKTKSHVVVEVIKGQ